MSKTVIIHGTKGSPDGNWFRWLAGRLVGVGEDVLIPRMPTPEGQCLAGWLDAFEASVGRLDEQTTLIGHSLGATFALRVLERLSVPVRRSVFVAGVIGQIGIAEYDALNSTFIEAPFNWDKIRSNTGKALCLSGDNDPYVPVEQGRLLAERLGVPNRVILGGGHLNAESGYLTFPELLEALVCPED
ncbi:MAG: RBBP9/YdeN family alpha/beta hydrolase [Pseudomonadota bacterium]